MFTCRVCGKEFKDVGECISHEYSCYETKQRKEADLKAEQKKELAKADAERIQKEYDTFVNDVKHHYDTYGEGVRVNGRYYSNDVDNMLLASELFPRSFDFIF